MELLMREWHDSSRREKKKFLSVCANEIVDAGAASLTDALDNHALPNLETLGISLNKLSE